MDYKEYKEIVLGKDIESSVALEKLYHFDEEFGGENYSEGFLIDTQGDDTFEYYFDFDEDQIKEYNKHIKPFATVDGTGGFAAFWIIENGIENAPIIVYGSEGQVKVVAKNLLDFMRLLTFDCELTDGESYKFRDNYEETEYLQDYKDFLKNEFNLDPVSDLQPDQNHGNSIDSIKITEEAENLFKEKFINWHNQFCEISYEE